MYQKKTSSNDYKKSEEVEGKHIESEREKNVQKH